ncbi:sporulation YhaL family protein [Niallia endozanthoxylica]|uniref:SigE-dependent sporulation protein n=1 Tax=Niallia endozanthoxylica TaxID=2036016 RepID=A0A5J5I9T9_9BACI|nr:sporulation YhaL family protein [Niallia endozanthoxylica]KAA9031723.1 SigE-dependent sporulation protein [Niallia endozanthoxylica]
MDIPFWIYFVVAGIIVSAYMVIRTGREERMMEDEIIEREGEVYMQRLEKEREEKKKTQNSAG